MKKLAFILLSLALMSSCAHKHKCACSSSAAGTSEAACAGCKDAASKGEACSCDKK